MYLDINKTRTMSLLVQGYYVLAVHEPAVVDQKMDFRWLVAAMGWLTDLGK